MNKKLFSFLLLLIILFIGAVYYTNNIQSPILSLTHKIQNIYFDTKIFINDTIQKHLNQAKHIQKMQDRLKQCNKNFLVMQQLKSQLKQLLQDQSSTLTLNPDIELIHALSYVKFDNFNRLWISMPDFNSSKIYGLVYKNDVAGIIVAKDNKPMALLNQDPKCAYPVFIGSNNVPGIAYGNNNGTIIVNYIPLWMHIKVGDKVTTSGRENLFFQGLNVGTIIKTSQEQGYRQAIVRPYFVQHGISYFYAIRRVF